MEPSRTTKTALFLCRSSVDLALHPPLAAEWAHAHATLAMSVGHFRARQDFHRLIQAALFSVAVPAAARRSSMRFGACALDCACSTYSHQAFTCAFQGVRQQHAPMILLLHGICAMSCREHLQRFASTCAWWRSQVLGALAMVPQEMQQLMQGEAQASVLRNLGRVHGRA